MTEQHDQAGDWLHKLYLLIQERRIVTDMLNELTRPGFKNPIKDHMAFQCREKLRRLNIDLMDLLEEVRQRGQ